MTDKEIEDIIRSNMNLQMNFAGIRADFEEKLQRTWVGLTDEEVESLQRLAIDPVDANGWGFLNRERFAYLIEIKLKEKNT